MIKITTSGATQIELGLERRIAALANLRPQLEEAAMLVYEATRQRFDSSGDGEWAPLAESTVARKASQGAAEPARLLWEEGNLYESATSPTGPYSYEVFPTDHAVVIGIDWEEDGVQIPQVLSQGAGASGGFPAGRHSADWSIPARPIWPRSETLAFDIGVVLLAGLRGI